MPGPALRHLAGRQGSSAVRHVWVIELENQGHAQSFGTPSADPYLAWTLPRMGVLLAGCYGIGRSSAANYVAQVSGQAPSLATQATARSGRRSPCLLPGGTGRTRGAMALDHIAPRDPSLAATEEARRRRRRCASVPSATPGGRGAGR